jgi:hypothetical protein
MDFKTAVSGVSLFTITLLGLGVTATTSAQTIPRRAVYTPAQKRIDTFRRLERHFARYEIKPTKVVRNRPDPARSSRRRSISIGRHKVEWINDVDATGISQATVRINGDTIKLKGDRTINAIDEDTQDIEWVNDWWQIRLYRVANRELLGIEMNQSGCTGTGCSVSIQLIYDLKNKKRNFFGTFRTDSTVRLFDFTAQGEIFYVAKSCDCLKATGEEIVTHTLYRLGDEGGFEFLNDKRGKPYYIRHSYFPEETEPYSLRVIPPKKFAGVTHNWIRRIE